MLIDSFIPKPDAVEVHEIEIAAPREAVYRALWTVDLGGSLVIKSLMVLRSLPAFILHPRRLEQTPGPVTLQRIIEAGFGRVAEEPGKEVVLGIEGRFWRPTGNIIPFCEESFHNHLEPGRARAVWNFALHDTPIGRTVLSTETRVLCGDAVSRWKFRAYWLLVRPYSGLIRLIMLREVKRACEAPAE